MTGDDLGYRTPKTRLVLDRRPRYTKLSGKADQAVQPDRWAVRFQQPNIEGGDVYIHLGLLKILTLV